MKRTRSLLLLAMAFSFFGLLRANAADAPLELGAALPAVSVPNQDGAAIDLATAGAKGFVLVYFYPKADTPGCTAQGCSLRDGYEVLTQKGVAVYGVSTDGVPAQKAFRDKYHLPFTLLADSDKKVTAAFGVPTTMGFAKRQAYLFKDGKLVWRDLAAHTKEQADDVLAALGKL